MTDCKHWYVLPPPSGAAVLVGICKFCGAEKPHYTELYDSGPGPIAFPKTKAIKGRKRSAEVRTKK